MKRIVLILVAAFISGEICAQHKTLTLYYPGDSTNVIDISNIDSMSFFICGVSKVRHGGKDYNTVLIGNQCWFKENLNVGTMINSSTNSTNNSAVEKYCYNNLPANCDAYGGLYQWREAMQYSGTEGAKGICPDGWHIPTLSEFTALDTYVSSNGNSLKAVGQGYGSGAGTNTSGFTALLVGIKNTGQTFGELTTRTHYWSSSKDTDTTVVHHMYLWDDRSNISFHIGIYSTYGFSVRCIKD